MPVTNQQVKALNPKLSDSVVVQIVAGLNAVEIEAGLNTQRRLRYFVAQAFHETQQFTYWVENMNYTTAERLPLVWPSRFTLDPLDKSKAYAPDYLRNPAKLANLVYASREGNGDVASGDGYRYRGRGAFHLTFFNNYSACSQKLFGDQRLITKPELVEDIATGIKTAGWFWAANGLNALADADEFTKVTQRISGSVATVKTRLDVLSAVQKIF